MKYLTVCLIGGEAEKFHQSLLYDIAKKFKLKGAIKRKPPTHLTLKKSFETERIKDYERIIKRFCENHEKTPFIFGGYNHFEDPWVLYVDVSPSKDMRRVHNELIDELHKFKWIPFRDSFDGKGMIFHASLAHTDLTKENFKQIWKYIDNLKKSAYELNFDNITILKLEDGIWKIHKKFLIK